MKNHNLSLFLVFVLLLAAVGCTTPRTLGYLLDMEYNKDYPARPAPELTIQIEDRLSIQVISENAELSAPFNTLLTLTDLASNQTKQPVLTYTVDQNGDIEFPVLGKIHVLGLTLKELEDKISQEIISRGYIRQPVVNASLDNFTITVIGERNAMIFPIEGKSLNLLQAIARFGGTNGENMNIQDVAVIRTENGIRRAYSVNLQKKDLFDSPVFYLQQNDIIYLKHKGSRMSSGARNFISTIGIISSFASLILSYLALTK
ncbi:MAG: polysaccharide biosynthesis/export family protein [Bacteroidales bacterium]|nr:polysaccharide biosynthesis/export family protein [Bacteroidales bacterium]